MGSRGHNFGSAATGIVLAIAFIRGIARREVETIGNFWVDFVRCNLYVLLPVCVIGALLLVSQGGWFGREQIYAFVSGKCWRER